MVKAGEAVEEEEEGNSHPLAASSSSTFDEPRETSRPDLMRHVQAALKRHRPLGTMQPSNIRPRRILREPSRIAKSKETEALTADRSSVTPPSATETASQEYMHNNNVNPLDMHKHRDNAAASGDTQKKVQFSLAENAMLSHRADERMATGTELLSSHLTSLSFTEMEYDASNMVQIPSTCGRDSIQRHPQQMNQSSAVGSSCMTTISVHSKSAPALNSTTYNSQPRQNGSSHMDIELEEPDVNPRPMSQGFPSQLSHPTYRCTSGMLADSSVAPTQMSISSLPTTLGAADQGLPKEQRGFAENKNDRSVEGRIDQAKGSSDDKLSKEKGNHADVIDSQSHAPMTKSTCTSVNVESSKSDKPDRSATHKETSGPRKKNYDPDIFVKVNGKLYQKLGKIGSGGSSEVYKVITSDCTIFALKRIKLKGRDYSTAYGFCQEIEYLKKLKGKNNIIQLIDYEVTDKTLLEEVTSGAMNVKDSRIREDGYIYMVLEYGEIDLAHMLSQKWKEQDSANWTMDENWLRFYWQEILQAVNTIHEERIVHSDLKPANFLFVKGSLKLIDFGIAKAIMSDTTNIQRDSQVGTLSYMSPEAFMCNENDSQGNAIKCGRPSDIWSLGCILYQMVYGRTPFAEYKTFWAKFKVITDRNHEIKYGPVSNPWLLDLMKKCLAWERKDRWRIPELLRHPFLVPPITPSLPNQGLDLLEQISETYRNDDETFRLCSQLQALLRGSGNTNGDAQLSMVSQMLSLWSQLQQRLASTTS